MNWFKSHSLESFINARMLLLALPSLILLALVEYLAQLHWQWIVVSEFILILFIAWSISTLNYQVMRSYTRAGLHLDAIRQEDYNQFAKATFSQGKVKAFHQQLNQLSLHLQQQKSRYDQHVFLVYQLITQLNSPVIVINEKQLLTFANDAFSELFRQPWQSLRWHSAESLGLKFTGHDWQFVHSSERWQIKHSEFIDNGHSHQLLVFIDIESALRENQLQAWQQIIRVLGHEIRNSLTPVSSMAETLADKCLIAKDKKILDVIADRCLHLQHFVDRYASLSATVTVNKQDLLIAELVNSLRKLFPGIAIEIEQTITTLYADIALFEQVLINLIKNAIEAEATDLQLSFSEHQQHNIIELVDNGHGFANLDNLFVPLYSTKTDGQGIGLSFCKQIIEQHNGVIELHNNSKHNGVTVMIILPAKRP